MCLIIKIWGLFVRVFSIILISIVEYIVVFRTVFGFFYISLVEDFVLRKEGRSVCEYLVVSGNRIFLCFMLYWVCRVV